MPATYQDIPGAPGAHPIAGPSGQQQQHGGGSSSPPKPAKPKLNWKNGPPSCKECVRLKLKVSLTTLLPISSLYVGFTNKSSSARVSGRVLVACGAGAQRSARQAHSLVGESGPWVPRKPVLSPLVGET
jgi:hypothetical protein